VTRTDIRPESCRPNHALSSERPSTDTQDVAGIPPATEGQVCRHRPHPGLQRHQPVGGHLHPGGLHQLRPGHRQSPSFKITDTTTVSAVTAPSISSVSTGAAATYSLNFTTSANGPRSERVPWFHPALRLW
jgi:hypothetical protein